MGKIDISSSFNAFPWLAGAEFVITISAAILVNILFAVGVYHDAQRLRSEGRHLALVGVFAWTFATLFGGLITAVAYWALHHSTFRAPERARNVQGATVRSEGTEGETSRSRGAGEFRLET